MSARLRKRMNADRAVRNAALAVVKTDIDNLRGDLQSKGVAKRLVDRMTASAADVADDAVTIADNNRGILAAIVGAVALWFLRNPIIAMFSAAEAQDDDDYDNEEERAGRQS